MRMCNCASFWPLEYRLSPATYARSDDSTPIRVAATTTCSTAMNTKTPTTDARRRFLAAFMDKPSKRLGDSWRRARALPLDYRRLSDCAGGKTAASGRFVARPAAGSRLDPPELHA